MSIRGSKVPMSLLELINAEICACRLTIHSMVSDNLVSWCCCLYKRKKSDRWKAEWTKVGKKRHKYKEKVGRWSSHLRDETRAFHAGFLRERSIKWTSQTNRPKS